MEGTQFDETSECCNTSCQEKGSSPHDFVAFKKGTLRNRCDDVFYIHTEDDKRGLVAEQKHQLNTTLLSIAERVSGFDEDGNEHDDRNVDLIFDDMETRPPPLVISPVPMWYLPPVTATH